MVEKSSKKKRKIDSKYRSIPLIELHMALKPKCIIEKTKNAKKGLKNIFYSSGSQLVYLFCGI
jgi:hypothetical protein